MPLTPEQLHAEATARILRALAAIQEAQGQLGDACSLLSSLNHGVPVWRATSKMYDQVHALWYKVEAFRMAGRYALDRDSADALQRRTEESKK